MTGSRKNSTGRIGKAAAFLFLLLFLPLAARAGGTWISVTDIEALPEKPQNDSFTGEIRITFLGDCTLGGPEKMRNNALGFQRRIEENGYGFPFRNLSVLTSRDDLTVANLEGVLSDRKLKKEKKKWNFIGPTAYTQILAEGSIECASLANNHTMDYGDEGYLDTKQALDTAGISWFSTETPGIWETEDGVRIGFLGVNYNMTGNRYKRYAAQSESLRKAGCSAVITIMHAGTEYNYEPPDDYQRQIVERAVSCGTDLVIGHHPHVVQGYTVADGVPVVYSLGNCSFGGTTHAKDSDALVVQAVLFFRDGSPEKIELHFYPISITSDERYNNYSPCFLTGEDAERVLDKMRRSTGMDPGPWNEETGAVVSFPVEKKAPVDYNEPSE